MTIRAFTTLFIGPGVVEWSTRVLAKVRRIFGDQTRHQRGMTQKSLALWGHQRTWVKLQAQS